MLFCDQVQLGVEDLLPYLLHVLEVGDHPVFNRVGQVKSPKLGQHLMSEIALLLVHAHHHSRLFRLSNDRGDAAPRCIVLSHACLDEARPIVHDYRHVALLDHQFNY
jgi:hypothetical protein